MKPILLAVLNAMYACSNELAQALGCILRGVGFMRRIIRGSDEKI